MGLGMEYTGGSNVAPIPVTTDNFQRAVFKAAPKRFTIEFLTPTKLGSTYYHGMHIAAISRGDRSSRGSLDNSDTQYDIWRRWEDCLWLQDTLESEYKRAAREKRMRLAQGKGVKTFNGMYKQDMASSWESLPPGPEPTSVATDVHAHIPRLTKKSTFFRPNPATIEKHQQEFQAMIEALMGDDVPALVKEIRASRLVTDFFGYWRRDIEFEEKYRKKNPHLAHAPRSSITSSVFSTYYPGATSSRADVYSQTRRSKRSLSSSATRPDSLADSSFSSSSTVQGSALSPKSQTSLYAHSQSASDLLRRAERDIRRHSSSSESSTQSEEAVSDSSYTANSSAPKIAEGSPPVKFNHNPQRGPEPPSPTQENADPEFSLKSPLDTMSSLAFHIRRQVKGGDRKNNRHCSVISPAKSTSPVLYMNTVKEPPPDVPNAARESWQTFLTRSSMASADTYLNGLDFQIPREGRESMQTVATMRTVDSADGVIPDRELRMHMPRASVPVSLSDFEMFSETDGQMSLLSSNGRPLSLFPEESECGSRPETPTAGVNIQTPPRKQAQDLPTLIIPSPSRNSFFNTPSPVPPSDFRAPSSPNPSLRKDTSPVPVSPTESNFSVAPSTITSDSSYTMTPGSAKSELASPSTATPKSAVSSVYSSLSTPSKRSSGAGSLSLKVSLNNSIIILKVSREIEFADLRQKIFNKFVGQEGIPLSHDYVLMLKDSSATIVDEYEWRAVESSFEGSKLLLQVINGAS